MNRIDRNFCMLDGTPCTRCNKCQHMPTTNKKSSNWLIKLLIAIILALIFLLLLSPVLSLGYNFANNIMETISGHDNDDTIIEESTDNYGVSPSYYQDYKGPVPYYDSGFYVYTYQDNPATCGGGKCPSSDFAYV